MSSDRKHFAFGITLVTALICFQSISFALQDEGEVFDYGDYASVLKKYVDDNGMVNYRDLKAQPGKLKAFVAAVGQLPRSRYGKWNEKDQIAFWLNAYNALTLKVIIDNYPIKASFFRSRIYPKNSIRQISGVWDKMKFNVMRQKLTLGHIEHKILRVKFDEPRIHMAMVCAAVGCPPLRNEPYIGAILDEQLDDQSRRFLANSAKFRIDRRRDTLYVSPIFKWFAEDFVKKYGLEKNIGRDDKEKSAVLNFIVSSLSEADKNSVLVGRLRIKYLTRRSRNQTGKIQIHSHPALSKDCNPPPALFRGRRIACPET